MKESTRNKIFEFGTSMLIALSLFMGAESVYQMHKHKEDIFLTAAYMLCSFIWFYTSAKEIKKYVRYKVDDVFYEDKE